jgi:outer membrane receptor protein involved in Fe transport
VRIRRSVASAGLSCVVAAAAWAVDDAVPRAPPASDLAAAAVAAAAEGREDEVTVVATRTRRDPFGLPQAVTIVAGDDLRKGGAFSPFRAVTRPSAAGGTVRRTSRTSGGSTSGGA